ncbi:hypothetical protein SKAU_G00105020 [Synaphobranchus kaupii]|uniref:Uncharacterized protein n=1 Tax=Synaphobranchus kaupii TaxID=118154 RepID=A0A9Q1J7H3_SYNKA|nr:hypothetical protein SKAU_G00105020 [Synaphobranchus kaupii]
MNHRETSPSGLALMVHTAHSITMGLHPVGWATVGGWGAQPLWPPLSGSISGVCHIAGGDALESGGREERHCITTLVVRGPPFRLNNGIKTGETGTAGRPRELGDTPPRSVK